MSNPTYVTGNRIKKDEYNIFSTGTAAGSISNNIQNLNIVWGTGYGSRGYGQDTTYIAPVATGDIIRSQEWDNLDQVLRSAISHQSGPSNYTGQSPTTFAAGTIITPIAALDGRIAQAYNNVGLVADVEETAPYLTTWTGDWGQVNAPANLGVLRFDQTLTFGTANQARYFFNAGGKIKLRFYRSGGPTNRRNEYWSDFCDHAGTVEIGYKTSRKIPGTGNPDTNKYTVPAAGMGGYWMHDNSGSEQTHFTQHTYGVGYGQGRAGYDYSYNVGYDYAGEYGYNTDGDHNMGFLYYENQAQNDLIQVKMQVLENDGIPGNIGRKVNVRTYFTNANYENTPLDNIVSGTMHVEMVIVKPQRLYIEDTWGTINFNGTASKL